MSARSLSQHQASNTPMTTDPLFWQSTTLIMTTMYCKMYQVICCYMWRDANMARDRFPQRVSERGHVRSSNTPPSFHRWFRSSGAVPSASFYQVTANSILWHSAPWGIWLLSIQPLGAILSDCTKSVSFGWEVMRIVGHHYPGFRPYYSKRVSWNRIAACWGNGQEWFKRWLAPCQQLKLHLPGEQLSGPLVECPLWDWQIVSLIPGQVIPKTAKMVPTASFFGTQVIGVQIGV